MTTGDDAMIAVAWCILVVVVIVSLINGVYMVASPKAWFRLPRWIKAQGSLSEAQFANGWGAVQVRIVGALILAALLWAGYMSTIGS